MSADVIAAWNEMNDWFEKNQSIVLETFRPPATSTAISEAERELGLTLPSDYKAFLAVHNGQDQESPRVAYLAWLAIVEWQEPRRSFEHVSLLPIEKVVTHYKDLLESSHFFSARWLPIACSPREKDFLCIDLERTEAGASGPITFLRADSDERVQVATSFPDLLVQFVAKTQSYYRAYR